MKKPNRRRVGLDGNRNSVKHNRYGKEMLSLEARVRDMIREYKQFLDGLNHKGGKT